MRSSQRRTLNHRSMSSDDASLSESEVESSSSSEVSDESTPGKPLKITLDGAPKQLLLDSADRLTYDLGSLCAFSTEAINPAEVKKAGLEQYLHSQGRDCAQLFINQLFSLPTSRTPTGDVLATLPKPTTLIPREKPIPKPREETRWEKFAKAKGIQKRKRSARVWDEVAGEWKRRHGKDRATQDLDQWIVEDSGTEDPWAKMRKQKRERVKEQTVRQSRNQKKQGVAERKLLGIPETSQFAGVDTSKIDVALDRARTSTASVGRFNETSKAERKQSQRQRGKRKFDATTATEQERTKNMHVLKGVLGKTTGYNMEKGASIQTNEAKRQARSAGKPRKGGGKGKGKGKRR